MFLQELFPFKVIFHAKFNKDNIYFPHNLYKILMFKQVVNFLQLVAIELYSDCFFYKLLENCLSFLLLLPERIPFQPVVREIIPIKMYDFRIKQVMDQTSIRFRQQKINPSDIFHINLLIYSVLIILHALTWIKNSICFCLFGGV